MEKLLRDYQWTWMCNFICWGISNHGSILSVLCLNRASPACEIIVLFYVLFFVPALYWYFCAPCRLAWSALSSTFIFLVVNENWNSILYLYERVIWDNECLLLSFLISCVSFPERFLILLIGYPIFYKTMFC